MTEKYILVTDDEYCYTLDTSDENYKTLEDFEKQEFENAKHDEIDIKDYEEAILQSASDNYWDWVSTNYLEADTVNDILNALVDENEQLKQAYAQLKHRHSLLHDVCIDAECDRDSYRKDVESLEKENEQLKQQIKKLEAQLYKVEDGVCDICNNMYLVQQDRYFVSKCKKGHDECSKMDLEYCDDFELKR